MESSQDQSLEHETSHIDVQIDIFRFPKEIRLLIFEHALQCVKEIHKAHGAKGIGNVRLEGSPPAGTLVNLLLANRQANAEATLSLYKCNWIRLIPDSDPECLELDIPRRHFSLLTNVTMTAYSDGSFATNLKHFLQDIAQTLISLRNLCVLIPRKVLRFIPCACPYRPEDVTNRASCRCHETLIKAEQLYGNLYVQLKNLKKKHLEYHNHSKHPMQFRFMAGNMHNVSSTQLAELPRYPQSNIAPNRVFEVYDSIMFAHLIVLLQCYHGCNSCENKNDKRWYFNINIVEQKPDENQVLVVQHDHFSQGFPDFRKLSAMAEEIRTERTG